MVCISTEYKASNRHQEPLSPGGFKDSAAQCLCHPLSTLLFLKIPGEIPKQAQSVYIFR